jgi:tetratricopeptide (TPR) repeat protein
VQMYQAAVDRDPQFAQALAGLATSNLLMSWLYYDRSPERVARAREAAERAVQLRPDLPEAHIALGFYYYHGLLSYPQALAEFAAALEIQPNNGEALWGIGFVRARQGRWQESADTMKKVAELDPADASKLYNLGFASKVAGRYADADRAYARAIVLNPQSAYAYAGRSGLQIVWHGDVDRAQAILDQAALVPGLEDEAGLVANTRRLVALARRDYQKALDLLAAETRTVFAGQNYYRPVSLLRGQVQRLEGQQDAARRSFEAARAELEQKIAQDPGDHRFHGALGIAYAGLGRRDDAVREAELGCELMPASKDAYRALYRLEELARVYTMVGRHDEAIAVLDDLLGRSGEWTPHLLRLDPGWDPLRSDPRFQALLTKYEVTE